MIYFTLFTAFTARGRTSAVSSSTFSNGNAATTWLCALLISATTLLCGMGNAQAATDVVRAAASKATAPSSLVSTEWLLAHHKPSSETGDVGLLVIDAQPTPAYAARHIPNAVHHDVFGNGAREFTSAQWQERLRTWGAGKSTRIVIYDAGGTMMAASLYFDLAYAGVPRKQLAVLDGGLARWTALGGAVERSTPAAKRPAVKPGDIVLRTADESIRVRLDEFLSAARDPAKNALVDALGPEHYYGGEKFFDRAGHVPNAINLPLEDFFNADQTFKSAEQVQAMATRYGITSTRQVLTHCGGGVAAAVPWFVFTEILRHPQTRLYRESQREWLRDERSLPFWTYANPRLVREQSWLHGWNHWMLRGAGVANVSVIDVRPAADYQRAHLPFSVNLPLAKIEALETDADAFAKTLGSLGVNAIDEIVLVSEGGINATSALAYAALKRLGHAHVSVLRGSVEDWVTAGYALATTPTAVGVPKSPRDNVLPPATYTPNTLVVVSPSPAAASAAAKNPALPTSSLVQTDGSPKPAAEIWKAMVNAKLSRHEDIVLVGSRKDASAGTAAVQYMALQLMGFPSVQLRIE